MDSERFIRRCGLFVITIFLPLILSSNDWITSMVYEFIFTLPATECALEPLSKIISPFNDKNILKKLFWLRLLLILIGDYVLLSYGVLIDFLFCVICEFFVVPKYEKKLKNAEDFLYVANKKEEERKEKEEEKKAILSKKNNGKKLKGKQKLESISIENAKLKVDLEEDVKATTNEEVKDNHIILKKDFDPIFVMNEDKMMDAFIKDEIAKNNIVFDDIKNMIPKKVLKHKWILNIIFGVLVFIYIGLIFFHYPLRTYITSTIILIVCCILFKNFDLLAYLKKEIKARPNEKVSNIIMITKDSLVPDRARGGKITCAIFAVIISIFVFYKPNIIYEKADNGYAVRFYICGITNFTTATIPSTYKGQDVVSLRGNVFSNMPFLTSVELPDTITEIRGQAFKNDIQLLNVNMPSKLEYIGGGSFYGCTSIKSVEFPDTVTDMGGEIFYGASSLKNVRLSENITEIRGNSFENCISLTSIDIPDNVIRIGGHAFYGDSKLSEVNISKNSNLESIGSSAFRQCTSLKKITIPLDTYVDKRAFKESPTSVLHYYDF